jgi:hypothetical protein
MSDFFSFWRDLYLRPRIFFENNFGPGKPGNRYFYFALFVFGTGAGIDRLDRQLTQHHLKGTLDQAGSINNWIGYWSIAILAGTLGGYISYLIGGWFYNVRVKWCKGDDDVDLSRSLFLYSGVVHASVIVLIAFITMFFQAHPYEPESPFGVLDACVLLLSVFITYYSVYVSFAGVTTVTNANWTRAVIWFMVLPAIFYTIMYITVIAIVYNYFLGNSFAD